MVLRAARWRFGPFTPATLLATVLVAFTLAEGVIGVRSYRSAAATLRPQHSIVPPPPVIAGIEPISIDSPVGSLAGWFVPSRNGAAVIVTHGFGANRNQMRGEVNFLAQGGFGVLAFDWLAHGESEGVLVTWGDRERIALVAAIDAVEQRRQARPGRIGLLGFSMGGATSIMVAASDNRIGALVIEASYISLDDDISTSYGHWGPFSRWPALWAFKRAGIDVEAVRPIDFIANIAPRPVMIVVGTEDHEEPVALEQRLFEAAHEPKEMYLVMGAQHEAYAKVGGDALAKHVNRFFERALVPNSMR